MSALWRFLVPILAVVLSIVVTMLLMIVLLWLMPLEMKANRTLQEIITTALVFLVWLPLAFAFWFLLKNRLNPIAAWADFRARVERFLMS